MRSTRSSHLRRRRLGAAGMTTAILIVAAWLAGRALSDRYQFSQWLLWIPTPAAVAAAALGLLAAAAPSRSASRRRRRLIAFTALTVILLLDLAFLEHRLHRSPPDDPPGLRIVHWNMTHALSGADAPDADPLAELGGRITLLTNAGPAGKGGRAADWLGPDATRVVMWPFTVLTNLPVIETRWLAHGAEIAIALIRIDATAPIGRPLAIYMVDLPSSPRLKRAEIAATTRRFLDAADAPPPDLVVGDFNMTRGSASMRSMFPGLVHAFDVAGVGYGATYPRRWPIYQIDHVLLGPAVTATSYRVADPGFGRHRLQVVYVTAAAGDSPSRD